MPESLKLFVTSAIFDLISHTIRLINKSEYIKRFHMRMLQAKDDMGLLAALSTICENPDDYTAFMSKFIVTGDVYGAEYIR